MYFLEQGPTEKFIMEQCARDRMPLPARIANSPELLQGLELYYLAFLDLTTCRGQGYGTEGPISWLTIDEYARRMYFDDEQREELIYHIQRLDSVYLQHKARKLEAQHKAK